MSFALIFDEKIVQIETTVFSVHPNLVWIDIASINPKPKVGWGYDGVTFTAPPSPTVDPVLTPRQRIIDRLRADPVLKAQVIDSFEARGITNKQLMLDALEAKFGETI